MNYKNIDEKIGNIIFSKRVVKRITQEQLTTEINKQLELKGMPTITRQSLSYYEHGVNSMPEEVFEICCSVLKINSKYTFIKALLQFIIQEVNHSDSSQETKVAFSRFLTQYFRENEEE